MDDRLTYKIGEKCAALFAAYSMERLSVALMELCETIGAWIGACLDSITDGIINALGQEWNNYLRRPVKKITPTHAAPVLPVQYRARSRC